MNALTGPLREVYGLFVEDGAFAITILAWVALFAALARVLTAAAPAVFLAGFLAILMMGTRTPAAPASRFKASPPPAGKQVFEP